MPTIFDFETELVSFITLAEPGPPQKQAWQLPLGSHYRLDLDRANPAIGQRIMQYQLHRQGFDREADFNQPYELVRLQTRLMAYMAQPASEIQVRQDLWEEYEAPFMDRMFWEGRLAYFGFQFTTVFEMTDPPELSVERIGNVMQYEHAIELRLQP